MPAYRGRYPSPAVALPSPPAACLVPGLPLPQARRSRDITPPDHRWLNARRPASDSMSGVSGVNCRCSGVTLNSDLEPKTHHQTPITCTFIIWTKLLGHPLFFRREKRHFQTVSKPAGLPLTQARRIAADSSPPDCRWLKPTGSALIHARWPPLSLAPWIKCTGHGQECRVSVLLCPQEHFNHHVMSCLVHGDSSGAGGSSCCGHGGHSSRLPPCCWSGGGRWGTLWGPLTPGHAQKKPQPPS